MKRAAPGGQEQQQELRQPAAVDDRSKSLANDASASPALRQPFDLLAHIEGNRQQLQECMRRGLAAAAARGGLFMDVSKRLSPK
jgi:hypothetical protein